MLIWCKTIHTSVRGQDVGGGGATLYDFICRGIQAGGLHVQYQHVIQNDKTLSNVIHIFLINGFNLDVGSVFWEFDQT